MASPEGDVVDKGDGSDRPGGSRPRSATVRGGHTLLLDGQGAAAAAFMAPRRGVGPAYFNPEAVTRPGGGFTYVNPVVDARWDFLPGAVGHAGAGHPMYMGEFYVVHGDGPQYMGPRGTPIWSHPFVSHGHSQLPDGQGVAAAAFMAPGWGVGPVSFNPQGFFEVVTRPGGGLTYVNPIVDGRSDFLAGTVHRAGGGHPVFPGGFFAVHGGALEYMGPPWTPTWPHPFLSHGHPQLVAGQIGDAPTFWVSTGYEDVLGLDGYPFGAVQGVPLLLAGQGVRAAFLPPSHGGSLSLTYGPSFVQTETPARPELFGGINRMTGRVDGAAYWASERGGATSYVNHGGSEYIAPPGTRTHPFISHGHPQFPAGQIGDTTVFWFGTGYDGILGWHGHPLLPARQLVRGMSFSAPHAGALTCLGTAGSFFLHGGGHPQFVHWPNTVRHEFLGCTIQLGYDAPAFQLGGEIPRQEHVVPNLPAAPVEKAAQPGREHARVARGEGMQVQVAGEVPERRSFRLVPPPPPSREGEGRRARRRAAQAVLAYKGPPAEEDPHDELVQTPEEEGPNQNSDVVFQDNQLLSQIYLDMVQIVRSISQLVDKQKIVQREANEAGDWSGVSRRVRAADSSIQKFLDQYETLQEEVICVRERIRVLGGQPVEAPLLLAEHPAGSLRK